MPSENTLKIINDLKAAGLDISSLERQILVNPLADKQADLHLGGGILRQSEYTRYMNDLKTKENTLNQQLNQLASLHDVENSGVQLSQEQKDAIKKMEDALIATGEFEEESIKSLSRIAMKPVVNVKKPDINTNLNSNLNQNQNPNNFQQPDLSKYVDVNTLQSSLANMAYGGIATSMEIQAAIDEVKGLGIKVDRAKVREFQEKLRTGYEAGKNLDQIVEETFEVSKALEAKTNQEIENRINTETERRLAEKLKEAGVPETNKFSNSRRHVLFDKNRKPQNVEPPKEGDPPANELPRNKFGDTEIFRGRRNREDRMQGASVVLDEVMAHYANDPTYVE